MPTMPKRIIFLIGSLFVEAGDLLWNNARKLLGLRPRGSCVVLTYHSVTSEERPLFARQMDTLLRYAKPVRADIEALPPEGGRYAAVTFDDGMQNIVDNALPELEKRSIPATLFIITDVLGKLPDWECFGPRDTGEEHVMSEEQLRKLPSDMVEIASHTMTHPVLPQIDREKLAQEVEGSRAKLAKMLGREIKLLSFPYGAFNDDVVDACRKAGYERVFSALPYFAFSEPQEFLTGRMGVYPTDWPIEFRLKVLGAYRWLPFMFDLKRKVLSRLRGQPARELGLKPGEKTA
jgi:peptidoglycan/xylan/chitin deacetylase (PgdA/CDA1 family)